MPTPAGDPLRKVTLNLYEADCREFERAIGQGWTVHIREIVNAHAQGMRVSPIYQRMKLGDLG